MPEADGILIAGVEYRCRLCGHDHTVYVSPVMRDGTPTLDFDSRHRVIHQDCPECEQERTHVAVEAVA